MKRFLIFILALSVLAIPVSATTRYVAQTAGTFSGGTACNGQTAITMTTLAGVTFAAGDTTYFCGTITVSAGVSGTALTVGQNGTSGNPITFNFDTGATIQAGAWSAGAIFIGGRSWLVINGANTGTIQGTANGTSGACAPNCNGNGNPSGYANSVDNGSCVDSGNSSSISNVTVENLSCLGIYVRTSFKDVANGNTTCIKLGGGANITVSGNTCSNMHWGIEMIYGLGATNSTGFLVFNNTVSNMDHGAILGDPNSGASTLTSTNCSTAFYNNKFSAMNTWDDTTGANSYHHDAIHWWANFATASYSGACMYSNEFLGDPGAEVSGLFSLESLGSGNYIFNNLAVITSATGDCADGMITHFTGAGRNGSANFWFNNLMKVPATTACGEGLGLTQTAGETSENNLFSSFVLAGSGTYVAVQSPTSGLSVSDFNTYGTPAGGNPFFGACGSGVSFATWKSGCGFDAHGQNVAYTLNSDFTIPSGSVVIGTATNLTSLGITALDTGAPQTFGAGGSCGTGCVARPSTGAWDPGPYPFTAAVQLKPGAPGMLAIKKVTQNIDANLIDSRDSVKGAAQ